MQQTDQLQNQTEPNTYPLLGDRIQSTFIDTMFLVFCMFILAAVLDRYESVPDSLRAGLFIGLWFVYEPLCTSMGATIGNYFKGIRVRRFNKTSKRILFPLAVIRYALKLFLGWVSFLTIHSNKERRAIHDFASGSVMIKV